MRKEEPITETVQVYASLTALLWLPLLIIYAHTMVTPVPMFGRVGMLGSAGLGMWAAVSDKRLIPLSLSATLYGVLITIVAIGAPGAFFGLEKWAIGMVVGEVVLILGAIAAFFHIPETK